MRKIFLFGLVLSLTTISAQGQVTSPHTASGRHPAEPEMVEVRGGTFKMGFIGIDSNSDEAPIHRVTVSGFHIGKYEVTQAQWRALMGTTVAEQRDKAGAGLKLYGEGDNLPMYYVNWDEAREFVRRLSAATGKRYALPTEAQWEFAARGGVKNHQDYTYPGSDRINDVSWSKGESGETVHPVGKKLPNELGIYDMSGNVYEWCGDWYDAYTATTSRAQVDPVGPSEGSVRVLRGGSWCTPAQGCRSTLRNGTSPDLRIFNVGFRVVMLP